jgi:hypothetical protein
LRVAESAGNRLIAVLSNTYRYDEEDLEVDQIIGDNATLLNDDLYLALKPASRNLCEIRLAAMVDANPPRIVTNPEGKFALPHRRRLGGAQHPCRDARCDEGVRQPLRQARRDGWRCRGQPDGPCGRLMRPSGRVCRAIALNGWDRAGVLS